MLTGGIGDLRALLDLKPVEHPAETPAVEGHILKDTCRIKRIAFKQFTARIHAWYVEEPDAAANRAS